MFVSVWKPFIMKLSNRMHNKKQNICFVFTLDYELWGDGTGNIFQQLIDQQTES